MVGDVPRGKDPFDRGAGRAGLDFDIAAVMSLELIDHQLIRRRMSNRHKQALAGDICHLTCFGTLECRAFHTFGHVSAVHAVEFVIPQNLDFGMFEQAVLQNLFRPQAIAPMDKRHFRGEIC